MFAVLFDLEGTLVRSLESDERAITEFRVKTRKKLLELGISLTQLENIVKSTLMRNKALEYVEKHFTEQEARRFHLEMDKFLKVLELSWARDSTIFPDTTPALRRLRELGYKMGVITNTSKEAANLELSIHNIEDYFDVVITREYVKKLKPDPEGILIALEELNARSFVFVGDLIYDFKATKKAGGISIIVDRNPLEQLEFDADYIVNTLSDIPSLVQQLERDIHLNPQS